MGTNIFIARQPILDVDRNTFGYELLYRDGPGEAPKSFDDPDDATRSVIERALLHWGMERVIGPRFGFVNASPSLVASGLHRALPPEGIIIELNENAPLDPSTVEAVADARREGYHFALDNVASLAQLKASQVLPHVSVVKVELAKTPANEIVPIVEYVRALGQRIMLLAEKVETVSQFNSSVDAGFELFQGYFFAKPEVLSRTSRETNATSAIALLAEMQRADVSIDRIEQIVGSDPSLTFRLLAVVNSSAFGLDRKVDSLRHAIVMLGVDQVRRLATLVSLSARASKSEELISLGATRAKLASLLVNNRDLVSPAFTVGLLSVTPALYDSPIEQLLDELPVAAPIEDALLRRGGELGLALEIVLAAERADVERLNELAPGRLDEVRERYLQSMVWSEEVRSEVVTPQRRPQLVGAR